MAESECIVCGLLACGTCDCGAAVCESCATTHDRQVHIGPGPEDNQEEEPESGMSTKGYDKEIAGETYDTIRDALYLILVQECPLRAKYILDSLDDAVGNNLFG